MPVPRAYPPASPVASVRGPVPPRAQRVTQPAPPDPQVAIPTKVIPGMKTPPPSTPANNAPTVIGGGPVDGNKLKAHLQQGYDRASGWLGQQAATSPWNVPLTLGAGGAAAGAVGGALSGALSDDPHDTALSGALSGGAKGGLAGLGAGGLIQAGHTMANPIGKTAAEVAAEMPQEFKDEIAKVGAHRVIAMRYNMPIADFYSALMKVGEEMYKNALPEHEIASAIQSFKIATEK